MTLVDTAEAFPQAHSLAGKGFRTAVLETPLSAAYWEVAPVVHRWNRYRAAGYVDPPVDPFELRLVDPDRITRFTGREFPVWDGRWTDFGAVREGEWDRRDRPPISPSYTGPDPSLYLADRFEETPLYRAMEAHFREGVPWKETDFVREVLRRAREGDGTESVWQHRSTVSGVERHCRNLDRLYDDIRKRGCLPQRERNGEGGRRLTFREVMEDEILVDVGRDGDPLFVTGRHRLAIAKILGLDRIPVAVVARHPEWVRRRDRTSDARTDGSGAEYGLGRPLDVPW